MKAEYKYNLENPPCPEDLGEGEDLLREFDRWAQFRSALTFIAAREEMTIEDAIRWDDLYQEALDYLEVDDQDSEGGGNILIPA